MLHGAPDVDLAHAAEAQDSVRTADLLALRMVATAVAEREVMEEPAPALRRALAQ